MNKILNTAIIMLNCLEEAGGKPVTAADLREYVTEKNGTPDLVRQSAKLLRDAGVMIISDKARHNTTWYLATTETQIRHWNDRMIREYYSEKRSQARALYLAKHPLIKKARRGIMKEIIALGELLDLDDTIVSLDCRPDARVVSSLGRD